MTSISSLFSVFFVLLFSSLSFATTLSKTDSVTTKQTAVIYVLGNTIIKGESSFSNANIITVKIVEKKSSNTKQNTVEKKEDQSISAQISKKEKEEKEKEKLAKIQKQVKEKPTTFLSQNQTSSDFNNTNFQNGSIAVASNNSYSPFKFLKVFLQKNKAPVLCEDKKNKQKFYTTLSYLHFGKYRSSSLRAPPAFV
ncbi:MULTISPECIES: hypothetical protein [unclassified Kaistella]|nr:MULTISPECIES: hypothetical protein [unclassified Kaistella]MDP2452579.1 hypothetical protein [Kaistella sp. SH11-4b]MDP2458391.1 hypothetical protein [Kaistella sp. SH19-2b]